MTMNIKTFINYDRTEYDKNGRKIHIWKRSQSFLSKAEVMEVRKNKENMKLKVS